MFRFLFQFVALLIFFAVARTVLTWIVRTVLGSFRASSQQAQRGPEPRRDQVMASGGELQKDPVCGTFVPVSSKWTRVVSGETVYFCSADCRERFLVSARA
jgi:YHS domain-containing protein